MVDGADLHSQDAPTDDMDLESLQQHTNGDEAFFEEVCETLQPLCVHPSILILPTYTHVQPFILVQDFDVMGGCGNTG